MSDPDTLVLIALAIGIPALFALAMLLGWPPGHNSPDRLSTGRDVTLSKVAFICLVFAIVIAWHLVSWQQGTACLIGRAPLREPPPPGKTCLIAYPDRTYVYSR